MNSIFAPQPHPNAKFGLAILRIITGLMMAYHGLEVFDSKLITEYSQWESIKAMPTPLFMAYLGKGSELVTGLLLALGVCTRLTSLAMAILMLFITFKIGSGKFWYQDQHPFLFVIIALIYFFLGGGKYSLDNSLTNRQNT